MNVGLDKQVAIESVKALFDAIPKKRQIEFIGEFNEALVYIERSTPGKEER